MGVVTQTSDGVVAGSVFGGIGIGIILGIAVVFACWLKRWKRLREVKHVLPVAMPVQEESDHSRVDLLKEDKIEEESESEYYESEVVKTDEEQPPMPPSLPAVSSKSQYSLNDWQRS